MRNGVRADYANPGYWPQKDRRRRAPHGPWRDWAHISPQDGATGGVNKIDRNKSTSGDDMFRDTENSMREIAPDGDWNSERAVRRICHRLPTPGSSMIECAGWPTFRDPWKMGWRFPSIYGYRRYMLVKIEAFSP